MSAEKQSPPPEAAGKRANGIDRHCGSWSPPHTAVREVAQALRRQSVPPGGPPIDGVTFLPALFFIGGRRHLEDWRRSPWWHIVAGGER